MKSMTGYAYNEITNEIATVSVEIKSYNSRFLDLNINIPSFLSRLETTIREKCSNAIQRGKVDVIIRLRELSPKVSVSADVKAAQVYAEAIGKIAEAVGQTSRDIPLSLIINQDGVLNSVREVEPEYYWSLIEPVFTNSMEQFGADRIREGHNLQKDLLKQLNTIQEAQTFFLEWMPKMEASFKDQLMKRFTELLGDAVDQQRVMTETAALLMKYTINEEVVRLKSHIEALKQEIEHNPAPGRKIDFICQELNREINTIGSKNQFVEVGQYVIKAKDALENIREQARNVE
jgi:uncharacterized protein (TIGR00255 family)